jgi:hypothetical protein
MKIQKSNNSIERSVLIGMITDSIVCGRISSKWHNRLFRSKWANMVSAWCAQYHGKYNKAPGKQVEGLYRSWERKTKDKDTVKLVEKFLSSLSDQYTRLKRESNSEYILDKAGEYFSEVRLERLKDEIETDLLANDITKALTRVQEFDEVKMGGSEGIDVLHDMRACEEALSDEEPAIVRYPGVLGKFFGNQLARDSFVSFAAPEKRGKSFWLMDVAFRAALQRRKVVFFEAGDMSRRQIYRRFMCRVCAQPLYRGTIQYPKAIRLSTKQKVSVDVETRTFPKNITKAAYRKKVRWIDEKKVRSKEEYLHLECFPNSTLHTKHIELRLKELAREGYAADVVVIDYSDILDMTYPKIEGRDRIDKTWRELRKISQMYHCLVVTATQTNRESYDAKVITRKHSSEDKRKLAHVTAMYGINQTQEEKAQEVMRLNCMELRDGTYLEDNCVYVAGCLAIGNVAIRSAMWEREK